MTMEKYLNMLHFLAFFLVAFLGSATCVRDISSAQEAKYSYKLKLPFPEFVKGSLTFDFSSTSGQGFLELLGGSGGPGFLGDLGKGRLGFSGGPGFLGGPDFTGGSGFSGGPGSLGGSSFSGSTGKGGPGFSGSPGGPGKGGPDFPGGPGFPGGPRKGGPGFPGRLGFPGGPGFSRGPGKGGPGFPGEPGNGGSGFARGLGKENSSFPKGSGEEILAKIKTEAPINSVEDEKKERKWHESSIWRVNKYEEGSKVFKPESEPVPSVDIIYGVGDNEFGTSKPYSSSDLTGVLPVFEPYPPSDLKGVLSFSEPYSPSDLKGALPVSEPNPPSDLKGSLPLSAPNPSSDFQVVSQPLPSINLKDRDYEGSKSKPIFEPEPPGTNDAKAYGYEGKP